MSRFANRSLQNKQEGGSSNHTDWSALNAHIVEAVQSTIGCEEGLPEETIAVIAGIVDYGIHTHINMELCINPDPNATGANNFRRGRLQKGKGHLYAPNEEEALGAFNTEGYPELTDEEIDAQIAAGKTMIRYESIPSREVGYILDFPEITVDKGQFFGESNPAPYRVLYGGTFQGLPSRPIKVSGRKNDNDVWCCAENSLHVKLAKAARINTKDGLPQDDILSLIGKQVKVQLEVYLAKGKYLQEKVSNFSPLSRGQEPLEYNEDLLMYVGFNDEENDAMSLRYLTSAMKSYMKQASNYEKSVVKGQIEALEAKDEQARAQGQSQAKPQAKTQAPAPKKATSKPAPQEPPVDFDQDIPF
ncbi:hypothetical protein [Pseudoalteromonas phage J2-1_QLiu-2017]|nr:hypothetical protein [Pseudoalteromonas phage J2-1_QLiu-2017]